LGSTPHKTKELSGCSEDLKYPEVKGSYTVMGLRIYGFVSLESVTMTVIYLTDTTQQKKY